VPGVRLVVAILALAGTAHAFSTASVRFYGTGGSPAVDRIKLRIDPPVPADVGAGDFTIELWMRGSLGNNATPSGGFRPGNPAESATIDWIYGNIFIDRDIFGPGPDFGMSVHRDGMGLGVLRFGTEDGAPSFAQHTLQGSVAVLDGAWHHVAFVRERASGVKRIYVDGVLDTASSAGASTGDLSYPDGRATEYPDSDPFLVLGAEKHGLTAGDGYPSFAGLVDEVRVWSVARTAGELTGGMRQTLAADTPGLVLYLPLEEGNGQSIADAVGGAPATLFAGVPGNGEWSPLTPAASAASTSTTSTSTTTVLAASTSTTVPQACALDGDCADADACTADRCDAGTCRADPLDGLEGIACRIEALASGALCSAAEGNAALEAAADERLERARTLLLEGAAGSAQRQRRLVRRAAGQLAKLRSRTTRVLRRERITPACAATIDGAIGALRAAILASSSV
jgi:hypothetical protein